MPIELTEKNFSLVRNALALNLGKKGYSAYTLVFFRGTGCPACEKFYPIFDQLEREVGGVLNFASIDISKQKQRSVIIMARKTKTPITAVPFLVMYAGSAPYAKYTGDLRMASLKSFISRILETSSSANSFIPSQTNTNELVRSAPGRAGRDKEFRSGYAVMGATGEDEDESTKLLTPPSMIPHNAPWEGSYRKMELELTQE